MPVLRILALIALFGVATLGRAVEEGAEHS